MDAGPPAYLVIVHEQQEVSGFVGSEICRKIVEAFEAERKSKFNASCVGRTTLYPGFHDPSADH